MEILDTILRTFVDAMKAGTVNLGMYTVPILGVFAVLNWYWTFGRSLAMGGGELGDALASALLSVVNIAIYYWLATTIGAMADSLIQTAIFWGQSVGGSSATEALLTPSGIAAIGWKIVGPLDDFTKAHAGFLGVPNFPALAGYGLATVLTILAFLVVAGAMIVIQIEFYLAAMTGALFIPFAVFAPTAFLAEFCITWLVGNAIRVFLSCAIVGLGFPLFASWNIPTGPGGSPTIYGAVAQLAVAWLYCGLAVVVPRQAANMCGRVSMGLTGSQLLSAPMGSGRFATGAVATANAIRGASQMLQRRAT